MKRVLLRALVIHKRRDRLAESTLYQYRCDLNRRLQRVLALAPTQKDGLRLRKRDGSLQALLFLFSTMPRCHAPIIPVSQRRG